VNVILNVASKDRIRSSTALEIFPTIDDFHIEGEHKVTLSLLTDNYSVNLLMLSTNHLHRLSYLKLFTQN